MGVPASDLEYHASLRCQPHRPLRTSSALSFPSCPPGGTLLASTDSLTARASGLALSGLSSGLVYVRTRGSMGVYAAG